MLENVIIRKSVKEDIPHINELFIQMVKTVNKKMQKEGIETYTNLENGFENNYLDKFYIDDSNVIYVAEIKEKVIGFISINTYNEYNYVYLDDFCVSEEYQKKGIGSKLMDVAFEFARKMQIDQIITHVESANKEAIEFYQKKDFKLVEEQDHRLLIRKVVNHLSKEEQKRLYDYNDSIIKKVLDKIKSEYQETIDLVGISGSFCSGLFYQKSDLDLLIVANGNADSISKCFIMDSIGQDIYYKNWYDLEQMAEYDSMFVTKLKELNIIYLKNENVLKKYKALQDRLNSNVNNEEKCIKKINNYYIKIINNLNKLKSVTTLNECYKIVGLMMNDIENMIFIYNKRYLFGGTKNILSEMTTMIKIPGDFVEKYKKILELKNIEDIKLWAESIVDMLKKYFKFDVSNIQIKREESTEKIKITKEDLIGSYEELYSNYYNKLLYASKTNNKFLSFRTMIDAQCFVDEFTNRFDISNFKLLKSYTPDNLASNVEAFEMLLKEWKKLYDIFEIRIEKYDSIDELYNVAKNKGL